MSTATHLPAARPATPLRLTPDQARQAQADGAVLLDLRAASQPLLVLLADDDEAALFAAAALQRLGAQAVATVSGDLAPPRLEVDEGRWEVRVDGEPVHLTVQEFRILLALRQAAGRVTTRSGLSEALDLYPVTTRVLDVHVCRLRRKLGPVAGRLVTVRGVGWRLLP